MNIQDELDSMINSLEGEHSEDLQGTTASVTTTPPPSTDAPATSAPATELPVTTAPSTDAPSDGDELARLIEENSRYKAELELLKKGKGEKPTTTAPATDAPAEPLEFISDSEFEDAINDPSKFNTLLGKVYTRAVNDTRKLFEPQLSDLPGTISQQVELLENMKEVYNNFYSDNPDLKPFQKVVGLVFEELSAENPDKVYVDVIKDVAPEVRRRLGLKETPIEKGKKSNDKDVPNLPNKRGKTGNINSNKQSDSTQSEIAQMNESLEKQI